MAGIVSGIKARACRQFPETILVANRRVFLLAVLVRVSAALTSPIVTFRPYLVLSPIPQQ